MMARIFKNFCPVIKDECTKEACVAYRHKYKEPVDIHEDNKRFTTYPAFCLHIGVEIK